MLYQAESAKEGSPERPCSSTEHSLLSQALRADSTAHTAEGSIKAETQAYDEDKSQTSTVVRLSTTAWTQHNLEYISLGQGLCFMTAFKYLNCNLYPL